MFVRLFVRVYVLITSIESVYAYIYAVETPTLTILCAEMRSASTPANQMDICVPGPVEPETDLVRDVGVTAAEVDER
jgi:hypothetical protein